MIGPERKYPHFATAARALACAVGLAGLAACSTYEPFNTLPHLRAEYSERLAPEIAAGVEVPFELDSVVRAEVMERLSPAGSERRRTEAIIDYVFSGLELEYSLTPTRNAVETFHAREGNCLSFVNLFVGIGRQQRLNPFYVEVEDYQRWNYSDGVVVSRGHIVAGINIDGSLSTYDFLPYRTKGYRDFEPIDDLTATAHYYNNLGAEALMAKDLITARKNLQIATSLAPDFEKAINNLGVVYLRTGEPESAMALYERGLDLYPTSVPLLTNLARLKQEAGATAEAMALLNQIEDTNQTNPFFFVYRGEVALSAGDTEGALNYMRRALRVDSETPEVHVGLAKVYFALGELAKSRHHVERALRLDATHDEARQYARILESSAAEGR